MLDDCASFRALIALEGEPPLNGRSLEGSGYLGAVNDSNVQFIYRARFDARQSWLNGNRGERIPVALSGFSAAKK